MALTMGSLGKIRLNGQIQNEHCCLHIGSHCDTVFVQNCHNNSMAQWQNGLKCLSSIEADPSVRKIGSSHANGWYFFQVLYYL